MQSTRYVLLENGNRIAVEVATNGDDEQVSGFGAQPVSSSVMLDFKPFLSSFSSVVKSIESAVKTAKPSKATVELGIDFSVSTEGLVAKIVSGSSNGSIKLILEWEE